MIDGNSATKGTLEADWKFLPPKEIKDPAVRKPADWVDEKNVRLETLSVTKCYDLRGRARGCLTCSTIGFAVPCVAIL